MQVRVHVLVEVIISVGLSDATMTTEHTNEGHLGHLFGVAVTFSVTISVVVMVMFIVIVGGVICVRVRRSKSYSRLIHEGEELNIQEEGGTKEETPVSVIWNKQMEVEKKVVQ